MQDLTPTAVGTWSGGRFMRFGEPLDDDRLAALVRPGGGIGTVITADAYGAGEADALLGRALAGVPRGDYALVGAIGHDFYEGERDGAKGFPRFTDPRLRGPEGYADYVRMATERSLERCGAGAFDLLLLHNPDRTGYTSEAVWDALEAVREDGLTRMLGVAPGPANGFTLDVIDCFERFGDRIDWAMVDPQPARAVARRAGAAGRRAPRRAGDHARRRLRRAVPRRRAPRPPVPEVGPPDVPAGGLDRARARAAGRDAPDRRAPRADAAPARVRVEPRARAGGVRGADADPGAGRGRADDRGQARRAGRRDGRARAQRGRGRRDPRDRRQHRQHGAQGRRAGLRGRAAARPLAARRRPRGGRRPLGDRAAARPRERPPDRAAAARAPS